MKEFKAIIVVSFTLLFLVACGNESEEVQPEEQEEPNASEADEELNSSEETNEDVEDGDSVEGNSDDEETDDSEESSDNQLSDYSQAEIEYARVWLSTVSEETEHLETIYFQVIPEGTAVIPDRENSPVYPETVIRLSGSRLAEGTVVYSGNGDGTINVYPVPNRSDDAVADYDQDMLEETTLVEVGVHDDNQVVELINKLVDYNEEYADLD
ncbi:hypothetical protein ACS127_01410 [Amphibacillus sp. Q70]|uniref:hypothetical protein n=1 Tax=Amphibacillus sp. Q70 TaxID=3453416 RepID=UPI003F843AC3